MSGGRIRPNQTAGNASRHLGHSLEGKPCNVFNSNNKIRIVPPQTLAFTTRMRWLLAARLINF